MSTERVRFTFSCQRCGSVLEARGGMSGQSGRCPTCGAVFIIPAVDNNTGLAKGPARVTDDGQLPTPMHAYANAGGRAPTIRRLAGGEQAIVCPRCHREMPVDSNMCEGCGLPFTIEGASGVADVEYQHNPRATAALTAGVISLLTFCIPVAGVIAIVLGVLVLKDRSAGAEGRSGRPMAIAGIVMGAISVAGFTVWVVVTKLF